MMFRNLIYQGWENKSCRLSKFSFIDYNMNNLNCVIHHCGHIVQSFWLTT